VFRRMVRQALRLVLLATLVVLAVCACGGGRDAVDRPSLLPEEEKPLRPGEYRSEEFKPSFFFRVGKGWTNAPPEASHGGRVSVAVGLSPSSAVDAVRITRGEVGGTAGTTVMSKTSS
jgi:hypothetical protein